MAQQSEVTITLVLTESEWCEVANALTTKATQIRDGHYGGEYSVAENDAWAGELESAYHKLATVLDEAGVTY